ncbi:hypothetical protein [Amycolatopsis sp. YIM 10]|uniref:hypothetical protein n=1 Tax=Amycolatopsis sp. YIM 10 TaxID=2653857 RepID=UPI0012907687|nr:hypothetical protein [Amycolatopsis sp. YIM 10]
MTESINLLQRSRSAHSIAASAPAGVPLLEPRPQPFLRTAVRAQCPLFAVLGHEVHALEPDGTGRDLDDTAGHRKGRRQVGAVELSTVPVQRDRTAAGAFFVLPLAPGLTRPRCQRRSNFLTIFARSKPRGAGQPKV